MPIDQCIHREFSSTLPIASLPAIGGNARRWRHRPAVARLRSRQGQGGEGSAQILDPGGRGSSGPKRLASIPAPAKNPGGRFTSPQASIAWSSSWRDSLRTRICLVRSSRSARSRLSSSYWRRRMSACRSPSSTRREISSAASESSATIRPNWLVSFLSPLSLHCRFQAAFP
jgi:hypothetical protein